MSTSDVAQLTVALEALCSRISDLKQSGIGEGQVLSKKQSSRGGQLTQGGSDQAPKTSVGSFRSKPIHTVSQGEQWEDILSTAKTVMANLQGTANQPSAEEQKDNTEEIADGTRAMTSSGGDVSSTGRIGGHGNVSKMPSSRTGLQPKPSPQATTVIPNALITTHVASTLFIMLDTLASTSRASWGMLYVYNDTLRKLVLAASCGQRYARPGSVMLAVTSHHFQPSLAGAAAAASATAPLGGGVIGPAVPQQHSPHPPNAQTASPNNVAATTSGGGNASSASIESRVLETGIGVNVTVTGAMDPKVTATIEEVDRMYHAKEMAQLISSGGGLPDDNHFKAGASAHEAKGRLSTEVAKAHRTRTLLVLPIFKPGSHNSEVIGLLQLGNKLPEATFKVEEQLGDGQPVSFPFPSELHESVAFTEDDECRATEAAAFIANIMVKYPHDLTHRNSHNHGISEKLAALVSGLPSLHRGAGAIGAAPPSASQSTTTPSGASSNTKMFSYFGAAVLRTSSLRAPQLFHRSEQTRLATIRRSEMRAGATLVSFKGPSDEWREVTQQARESATNPSVPPSGRSDMPSEPRSPHFSAAQQPTPLPTGPSIPRQIQPPAYLPQLPSGATVADALEHTIQVGESWKNAVLLNIELETETRRLHEALRICRREISRLQDMLLNLRQAGGQMQPLALN